MAIDLARTATSLITPPTGKERPSEQFLVGFRQSMLDRFRDRNDDFDTLVNAWHGTYYQTSGRAWNMDAAGKPILRLWDRQMSDQPVPHNIYKGFVDAYKRSLVGLPDARIPKPNGLFSNDLEGQKAAEQWTERMRRAAYGIWAYSQRDVLQIMDAWWLCVCGSYGSVLVPDLKRGIPKIHHVAPWDIYGIKKVGDPIALSRCIVVVDEDPLSISAEWPDKGAYTSFRTRTDLSPTGVATQGGRDDGLSSIQHSIYLDEHWFIRMIGDDIVAEDFHDLGFCPALIPPLFMLPGYVNRGHSVAEQTLPMQHSIDYAVNLWEAGMKDAIFKTAWVKDPQNVPENWARGKGMLITINADGDIGEFGGDPNALKMVRDHFELQRTMMELNTGVSRAAQSGQVGGSINTGRGIEKSQGPYLAQVEEIQTTSAIFNARELLYAFAMLAKHELWDDLETDTVEFSGYLRKVNVHETFARKDFKDVKAVEILFAPMAHLGLHERVNIALQLYNTKPPLLSWQRIVELTSLVDDVEELRAQIESDDAWRIQNMQREVAAKSPAPPGPPPGGGGPEQADAARQAGATNVNTLRQAGAGGPPPAPGGPGAPGEEIPAAGAPAGGPAGATGMGVPGQRLTDQQVLDPERLKKLMGAPPEPPQHALPSGLGDKRTPEQDLGAELSTLKLHGPAYLLGNTLYVDYRDKRTVKLTVEHHDKIKVETLPRGVVPQNAKLIAGGEGAGNSGRVGEHSRAGAPRQPEAQPQADRGNSVGAGAQGQGPA